MKSFDHEKVYSLLSNLMEGGTKLVDTEWRTAAFAWTVNVCLVRGWLRLLLLLLQGSLSTNMWVVVDCFLGHQNALFPIGRLKWRGRVFSGVSGDEIKG